MVEGGWCETSRGHFLRGCLNEIGGRALQELVVVLCWAAPADWKLARNGGALMFGSQLERACACVGGVHTGC